MIVEPDHDAPARWRGNSKSVVMVLSRSVRIFVLPAAGITVGGWSAGAFRGGVGGRTGLGGGGWWVLRWGRYHPGLAKTLWVKLWCPPGMLHMVMGANQLFYVAAISMSVPAAVVFLSGARPVATTLALGWVTPAWAERTGTPRQSAGRNG